MDKDKRIKELEERVEVLEEAVRIQNKVTEGAMEAGNYWRAQAIKLLDRQVREELSNGAQ